MRPIEPQERQLAEAAARMIEAANNSGLPDLFDKITPLALGFIARAYIELRAQIRALHDLVDQTDPNDPIGVALTKIGLERRPHDPSIRTEPRLMRTPTEIETMPSDDLRALYCRVMRMPASFFKHATYIVRLWDGMDGCWTDCTGEVSCDEALRYWALRTAGGSRNVAYGEIDYYSLFPGGSRMQWDGSEGREMHR